MDMDAVADANRQLFANAGVLVLNVLASPGSGKTSVMLALIEALRDEFNIAVIEADAASRVKPGTIRAQGIAAVQVDAAGAGELDAAALRRACETLELANLDLVLLENAGSLAGDSAPYLGEGATVAMMGVPEGALAPLEHPAAFRAAQAVVLNKADTMQAHGFDLQAFRDAVAGLNPAAPVFALSATTGQGVEAFASWVADRVRAVQ